MTLALLVAISLTGIVGLKIAPPRPRAQELWATIALFPIPLIVACAFIPGGLS
jgi:hypothetical protein